MANKIEFTDTAKKEISRIISQDTAKNTLEYPCLAEGAQVLSIISHLKKELKQMITFLSKLL